MPDNQKVGNDPLAAFVVETEQQSDGSHRQIVGTIPVALAFRSDDVGSGVVYVGEAAPGSATSSAVWRIRRITTTGEDITWEWADGDAEFDNVYDNRTSLNYS